MFSSDRILTLNVGSSKIAVAEFMVKSGRQPELLRYGMGSVGSSPDGEPAIELSDAIKAIMRAKGIRSAPLMVALSGQVVFPRFVRLPAVGADKLLQLVEYEVEQNVPFPMDEIVWNHQYIGDDSTGEQSAMIVAAKIENVREVTDHLTEVGIEPEVVDVAPMALYNCLRYNYSELDGCTVLLDIGARSTNLIFIEDDKIYSRCIPVAGNAITQDIAKGFAISFKEADALKRDIGYVSLGGVYAAENPRQERISKIIRNVVTRLHAEINRSVNFYRSQQGGSAPVRLFLTGGSAAIPQLDNFFRQKLNVQVDYLNPFMNVGISRKLDSEQVGLDAFMLAESVGLALRRSLECPIEINLMPPEIIKHKSFKKRMPFFGLAVAGLLMSLGIWTVYEKKMADLYVVQGSQVAAKLSKSQKKTTLLKKAEKDIVGVQQKADAIKDLIITRTLALKRVSAIRQSIYEGMWVTALSHIKDSEGNSTGVRIIGRGWIDKLREIEAKAEDAGRNATAVEELRDRLKAQTVFGRSAGEVKITGIKDIGAYMIEFTIEARSGTASEDGGARK
ncbi:MAG: type IV pilus assembly protein PilM [Kiritimatiellae bacterium]|nr:type IV pilus assembly protein PilM [Kiritimatiellia bacterium]